MSYLPSKYRLGIAIRNDSANNKSKEVGMDYNEAFAFLKEYIESMNKPKKNKNRRL